MLVFAGDGDCAGSDGCEEGAGVPGTPGRTISEGVGEEEGKAPLLICAHAPSASTRHNNTGMNIFFIIRLRSLVVVALKYQIMTFVSNMIFQRCDIVNGAILKVSMQGSNCVH
jgi:hypothetical protein